MCVLGTAHRYPSFFGFLALLLTSTNASEIKSTMVSTAQTLPSATQHVEAHSSTAVQTSKMMGGDILIMSLAAGRLPAGKHFAYIHIFVAVSTKAECRFARTVARELKVVSRNMAWACILKDAVGWWCQSCWRSIAMGTNVLRTFLANVWPGTLEYSTVRESATTTRRQYSLCDHLATNEVR